MQVIYLILENKKQKYSSLFVCLFASEQTSSFLSAFLSFPYGSCPFSCLSKVRCFSDRLTGIVTLYVTHQPKLPSCLYIGNPFPFRRTFVPFCVPGRTFNFTFPFKVFTVISPPKIAVYISMEMFVDKSLPVRLNSGSSGITKVIYKSPFGSPFAPLPPCPFSLITCPFSTPAGIVIRSVSPFMLKVCLCVVAASRSES